MSFTMTTTSVPLSEVAKRADRSELDRRLAVACHRLSRGDMRALEEIYGLLGRELYAFAVWSCGHSQDAEDLVQEVFLKLIASADKIATARRPRAYLFKVLYRLCIDHSRTRSVYSPLDELLLIPIAPSQDRDAEAHLLSRKLQELPVGQRQCLLLREVLGMSFREIAVAMDSNLFTTASRHRLAMVRLRRALGTPR
jgi:RNA polymerase sigma-70 factor (ECF subfamily)